MFELDLHRSPVRIVNMLYEAKKKKKKKNIANCWLVYSHTDEHPAEEPDSRPRAETSTEAIRFAKISSVALSRVVPDPAAYVPGVTMPSEVMLTIGWNVLSHLELEPSHRDENGEVDHGYLGRPRPTTSHRGSARPPTARTPGGRAAELRAGAVRRHGGPRKLKTRWAVADSPFRFAAAARQWHHVPARC